MVDLTRDPVNMPACARFKTESKWCYRLRFNSFLILAHADMVTGDFANKAELWVSVWTPTYPARGRQTCRQGFVFWWAVRPGQVSATPNDLLLTLIVSASETCLSYIFIIHMTSLVTMSVCFDDGILPLVFPGIVPCGSLAFIPYCPINVSDNTMNRNRNGTSPLFHNI